MECDGSICTASAEDIPPPLYGSELVTNHPVVTNNNTFIQRSQISDPKFIPLGADNVQKKLTIACGVISIFKNLVDTFKRSTKTKTKLKLYSMSIVQKNARIFYLN